MEVRQSISIRASAEDVFNYLIDPDNRREYIPLLEEVIMLDPLPIKEGSRYIEVATIAGRKLRTSYQVIRYEPNELISAKTIKSIFPIQVELTLNNKNDHSILSINLELKLAGFFRLASGVVKRIVDQQAIEILKKIKQNLEK